MFHRSCGLGQYSAEDVAAGGDVWTGSIYDPGMVPSARVTEWVAQQPSTSFSSGGLLPVLQNIVSAAGNVVGSYLKMSGAKEQAKARVSAPAAAATRTIPTGVQTAGMFSSQNLPILGILAIGAFLVLRKGKGAPEEKRRRRG